MKKSLIILAAASAVLLSGCAQNKSRWEWNGYQDSLWAYYGQEAEESAYGEKLLAAEQQAAAGQLKLAPGLFAEIGTFYLRQGKKADAIAYYKKEADAWPESTAFMTSLIDGIERTSKRSEGEAK